MFGHAARVGAQGALVGGDGGGVAAAVGDLPEVVAVAKDTPGFIVNRVARPFYGESLRIYEEGLADFSTIDTLHRLLAARSSG